MATFQDHFSGHASSYASHRPSYPRALYEWLATLTDSHEVAWDCATGNGQAAVGLVEHYKSVVASDASARQVASRQPHSRVHYFVSLAERVPLWDGSCDLLTVAQAVHWFEFNRFFAEARRVLKRGGAIAVWSYERFTVSPAVDEAVEKFYSEVVGPYWPPERRYVELGYRTLPFPFDEVRAPAFDMELRWTREQVLHYISTWSAVQRYQRAQGTDPLPDLRQQLAALWVDPEEPRTVRWPIHIRAGYA